MLNRTIHNPTSFSKPLEDHDLRDLRFNLIQFLKVLDDLEIALYQSRKMHSALQRICRSATVQENQ